MSPIATRRLAAGCIAVLAACSSDQHKDGPTIIDLTRRVRDTRVVERSHASEPSWVLQPGSDAVHLRFVGSADSASKSEANAIAWQNTLQRIRESIASNVGSIVDVDINQLQESGARERFQSNITYRSRTTTTATGVVINALQVDSHWYHTVRTYYIPQSGQHAGQDDLYHADVLAEVNRQDFDALVDAARRSTIDG